MADQGVKISLPNNDVRDASIANLVLTSKYQLVNTLAATTISYTFNSDPGIGDLTLATIPHQATYKPTNIVYYDENGGGSYSFIPWINYDFNSGDGWSKEQKIITFTDAVNLYIKYRRIEFGSVPGGSGVNMNGKVFVFKYYIMADQAN